SLQRGLKRTNGRAEKQTYGAKHDDVILNFSAPVRSIESDKCIFLRDTVSEAFKFTSENANEDGNLVTTYLPSYKRRLLAELAPQKKYTLVFLPGALESFWG